MILSIDLPKLKEVTIKDYTFQESKEVTFKRPNENLNATVRLLDNDNFGNQAKQSFLNTISSSEGNS